MYTIKMPKIYQPLLNGMPIPGPVPGTEGHDILIEGPVDLYFQLFQMVVFRVLCFFIHIFHMNLCVF